MDNGNKVSNVVIGQMLKVEVNPGVGLQEMVLVALDELVRGVNGCSAEALEAVAHWYGKRWAREEYERLQLNHERQFKEALKGLEKVNFGAGEVNM